MSELMQKNISKKDLYKKNFVWTDAKTIFKKNYIYIKMFLCLKFIMAGISNQHLLNFLEEKTNDDI